MILIQNLRVPLSHDLVLLGHLCCKELKIVPEALQAVRIRRQSVDARDKADVHFVMHVLVSLQNEKDEPLCVERARKKSVSLFVEAPKVAVEAAAFAQRPVVVGAGPAGLMAALTLARAGARPILVERGKAVEGRQTDVETFMQTGKLLGDSNTLFGEGGAGTFSDGKLTTGTKSPHTQQILQDFVEAGAPESILYDAKPHIGTDRLRQMVKGLREEILRLGGEVWFETRLSGIQARQGKLCQVELQKKGERVELQTDALLLCIGHSARDTFAMLLEHGVLMVQKPFSIGLRIEHPQRLIDVSQYGSSAGHKNLGAADYKLSCHLAGGRSVYTFCMCPGGQVVPASSEEGRLNVNGMSVYARDGENANSALLVGIDPSDFGSDHPLAGIAFQRRYEALAFGAGGGGFIAPGQRLEDFMQGRASRGFGDVAPSYLPGVAPADLRACLPDYASDALREAIPQFARRLKGFDLADAVLTGIEARSSSPVRIPRDARLQANIGGIYPVGEGAGYAGGILSAAADGVRCAMAAIAQSKE